MEDESIEIQDSQPDEVTNQEPEMETTDSEVEDTEALKALNKQLYERAKKAEAKAKELEKAPKTEETINQSSNTDERFERLELKTEGYKDEEIDFLMQNGGKDALSNKLVMAAIEATRKAEKSANATPTGTNKSPVYQKFTESDLKRMSIEELEKIVPQE